VDIISLRAKGTDMYGDGLHFAGEMEEPEYYRASGTSMAAPYVTGLAALLASRYPDARWTEVRNLILSGGDVLSDLEGGTVTGRRINAQGSLSCTNGKVFSALEYSFDVGIPNLLTALSIDCARPVGPVVVTTSSGDTVSLLDDGIAPDRFAGDGIFTALWVPTCGETSLTFASPLGTDTVTPGPSVDLTISEMEGPQRAYTGEAIAVRVRVKNVGAVDATAFLVSLYLSRDAGITSSDIVLGHVKVISLEAGQEQMVEATVRLPNDIDSGTYYLGALADLLDMVKESNETNNAAVGPALSMGRVFPDLVVSAVSSVQSVVAGRQFTVTGKVRNQGRAPVGRLVLAVYISPDALITRADTPVGTVTLDTIQSGEERGFVTTVTVPLTQRAGIHYIGAIADPWNQVAESNEANNTRAGNAVTVRKPSRSTPLY
jgi:hypothetical protein